MGGGLVPSTIGLPKPRLLVPAQELDAGHVTIRVVLNDHFAAPPPNELRSQDSIRPHARHHYRQRPCSVDFGNGAKQHIHGWPAPSFPAAPD